MTLFVENARFSASWSEYEARHFPRPFVANQTSPADRRASYRAVARSQRRIERIASIAYKLPFFRP